MAKKKKQVEVKPEVREIVFNDDSSKESYIFSDGCRDIKDFLAPAGIQMTSEQDLLVEDCYTRGFVMTGMRPMTQIGWLDDLYNYNGDMDTCVYIEPVDERRAIDELTKKIAQYEANQLVEAQKGSIKNTTKNANILKELYRQRSLLEANMENMFKVEILAQMYQKDLKELNKESQKLITRMAGKKNKLMPLFLRQEEAYRSTRPFGINHITDWYRNFGTGAAGDCFPFYNVEYSQDHGYMFALNRETGTPIFIDPFDRTIFNNANISIFGGSGAGKTYTDSLVVLHMVQQGCYGVLIDADGELGKVVNAVGGEYLTVAPGEYALNPFDVDVEDEVTEDGEPTGRRFINIKDKASSLLNMIAIMSGEKLDSDVRAMIADCLLALYAQFGITEDPESIFIESSGNFDAVSGEFTTGRVRKIMPVFSDFHAMLVTKAQDEQSIALMSVADALKIFCKGGLYDMFDGQTTAGVDIENAPLVAFNVSKLEENVLRPIAMYVVFSWVWDKFIKRHPERKKFVLLEEAWMMIKESLAGSEYTAEFTEKAARRIRKRNGCLIVSSQNVREFEKSSHGQAVLDNTTIKILMKQEPADINTTQRIFQLSEGEKNSLIQAKRGECLIKMNEISTKGVVYAFDFEDKLISKKYLQQGA